MRCALVGSNTTVIYRHTCSHAYLRKRTLLFVSGSQQLVNLKLGFPLTIFDYFVEEFENVKYLRVFYDEGNPQPLSFETDIEDSYSHPTSFEEALFGWFVVPLMLYLNSVLSVLIEHFCFNAAC